jgi:alpha-L-fucosidase
MSRRLPVLVILLLGAGPAGVMDANLEARRSFQDARFGLFIHWGVYSLLGKGEGVMEKDRLPVSEYEKLPPQFNPAGFDADEWVKTARGAGMKFLLVTAKDHDGFCMFDTALTRFDVVDATPFAKDPLKALADACQKHGLKLFFHYSLLDWHHPDSFPRGKTGRASGRDEAGDWSKYVAYYQGQVRELCTHYGPIGGIWLDGGWDRPDADWDLAGTSRLVHDLQPGALVGSDLQQTPRPGEDFRILDQVLPPVEQAAADDSLPLVIRQSLNSSRGYTARDKDFKSPEQVIHLLLGAAGRGANLLLSIGPKPDGTFPPEATERLQAVGLWLDKHGDSVYGTRRGPIAPQAWGVSTAREKLATIYLHVLKPEVPLALPKAWLGYDARAFRSTMLLKKSQDKDGFTIEIPEKLRTPIDTVIVLTPGAMGR